MTVRAGEKVFELKYVFQAWKSDPDSSAVSEVIRDLNAGKIRQF